MNIFPRRNLRQKNSLKNIEAFLGSENKSRKTRKRKESLASVIDANSPEPQFNVSTVPTVSNSAMNARKCEEDGKKTNTLASFASSSKIMPQKNTTRFAKTITESSKELKRITYLSYKIKSDFSFRGTKNFWFKTSQN